MLKYVKFLNKINEPNQPKNMSKLFEKPAIGRVHLYLNGDGSKEVLVKVGPILAKKLSSLLRGVMVTPRVVAYPKKPGCYRLLFDVPSGTCLPEGVEAVARGKDVLRVVTFPLEAISLKLRKVTEAFEFVFKGATISPDGEELLLLFGNNKQQVINIRGVAKRFNLTLREPKDPKPAERGKTIYLVTPLKKQVVATPKVSKPKQGAALRPRLKKAFKSGVPSRSSLRLLVKSALAILHPKDRKDIISSALADLTAEEFSSVVSEVMPRGLLLQAGTQMPSKKKGTGTKVREELLVYLHN